MSKGSYFLRILRINICCLFFTSALFAAQIVGSEVLLCDNGYSPDNTTCTTYGIGNCDSGYHDITPSSGSFMITTPSEDLCDIGGYKPRTLPDTTVAVIHNGAIVGSEVLLCDNGYSPDNTTCTTYGAANCPTGYYGVVAGSASFAPKNGSCATGYSQYIAQDSCGYDLTASTCIDLCDDGRLTTNAGTCATLCGLGITTFRTSNGVIVPLWSSAQTQPSLNVGYNNGVCYGNLTDEPTDETSVWVRYGDNDLHMMK